MNDKEKADVTNDENKNVEIYRVAIKPPMFWRQKPNLWFFQLEAQFANNGISQDLTKYNTVVSALDENVLEFVVDVLSNPPQEGKYDALKNALLIRLTDTEESRLKKLLTDLDLGDKRPSDLLRQMKSLAGKSISEEVIKSLWLQRLPPQTQAILSISKDPLDNIAEMADKILAVYNTTELCSIDKTLPFAKSSNSENSRIDVLEASIASLTKKFDEFSFRSRSQSKPRHFNGRSRSRSRTMRYKFCWYHFKFGKNATKCVEPCEFKSSNTTSEN